MRIPNILSWVRQSLVLALIACALLVGWLLLRPGREDLPWTPLSLTDPVGMATRGKIVKLTGQRDQCLALLESSGLEFTAREPFGADQCRVEDAARARGGGCRC